MYSDSPRIVFMGTPELAMHVLDQIIIHGHNVVAVVTAPDKPAGRGRKIKHSPVKQYALNKKLRLLQPEKLKAPGFVKELESLKPDIQVVVAFRMLPETVWKIPPMGTFNLHASLLPDYRGAAPINWVIINGEKETGVTTFMIDQNIDTGNILLQKKIAIDPNETAGTLHEKIKEHGANLVIKTIRELFSNKITPIEQSSLIDSQKALHLAPKIYKEDCKISWDKPSVKVVNKIHGLSPYPGAFCYLHENSNSDIIIKVFEAKPEITSHNHPPGKLFTDNKSFIKFTTPDGFVRILQIQLPGKRRMSPEELLRGYRFNQFE